MCLQITRKNTKNRPNKEGLIKAYKVVRINGDRTLNLYENASPTFYHIGENTSSRIHKLTSYERKCKELSLGFHLISNLGDATNMLKSLPHDYYFGKSAIIEVFYRPRDVIAYGIFSPWRHSFEVKSIVVTKLTIKSIAPILQKDSNQIQ